MKIVPDQTLRHRAAGQVDGLTLKARQQRVAASLRQKAAEVGSLDSHAADRPRGENIPDGVCFMT